MYLRYATRKEQNENRVVPETRTGRQVVKYDLDANFIKIWPKINDAAISLKLDKNAITKVCRSKLSKMGGFIWRYYVEYYSEEKWVKIFYPAVNDFYASSCGRIMKSNGFVTFGKTHADRYLYVNFRKKNEDNTFSSIHILVHRIIACAFLGPSELHVNHKDDNKTNNRIDNLEYVTEKENQVHALQTGIVKSSKPVYQFNVQGQCIAKYISINDAARKNNILPSDIIRVCKVNVELVVIQYGVMLTDLFINYLMKSFFI